jgi:hypothetical protein
MTTAAPPPLLMAHREGGDVPISLFLDTDLGTHLALLVAPDTDIRGLKCTPLAPFSPVSSCRDCPSELIRVLAYAQRRWLWNTLSPSPTSAPSP